MRWMTVLLLAATLAVATSSGRPTSVLSPVASIVCPPAC
jgi:hypothetical protein